MSGKKWQILRKKPNVTNESTDYEATQTDPGDTFFAKAPHAATQPYQPPRIEMFFEFRDANNALVVLGSSDIVPLRRLKREFDDATTYSFHGGPTLSGQKAARTFVLTDVDVGDEFGIRFSAITAPATSTQIWLYYRELQ